MERIIRSALRTAEQYLTTRVADWQPAEVVARLRALVATEVGECTEADEDVLWLVKSVPGNVSLESMLTDPPRGPVSLSISGRCTVRSVGHLAGGIFDGEPPFR